MHQALADGTGHCGLHWIHLAKTVVTYAAQQTGSTKGNEFLYKLDDSVPWNYFKLLAYFSQNF